MANNCIDGICCDPFCFGTCRSCALAKTGQENGTCAQVLDGQQSTNGCSAAGQACSSIGCVPAHCFNAAKDGDESDTDCGGSCPGCAVADTCTTHGDCLGSNCIDGICCDPFCFGTCRSCALAKTGQENGTCAQVLDGQQTTNGCSEAGQACSSIGCVPTHCFNAAKDGDESDTDCGGSCPGCAVADTCTTNSDCSLGNCIDGLCCDLSCFGTCRSCALAKTGQENGTCVQVLDGQQTTNGCSAAGQACSSIGCVPTHCFTAAKDGDETDVDCGGSCPGCDVPNTCNTNADCAAGNCVDGICCDQSCSDICHSCALTTTGQPDGTCAQVLAGQQTTNGCHAEGEACTDLGSCAGGTPASATPTETPTPAASPTPTNTAQTTTPVDTPTPTATVPVTATDTATQTPEVTNTPTLEATNTPTPAVTNTPTPATPQTETPIATPTDTAAPTTTATERPTPTSTPSTCAGDCNGLNSVTIDELVLMVNLALDGAGTATCKAGDTNDDDTISIDELVKAVKNALEGCP